MSGRQKLGRWGEALAAEYLEKKGYREVARNARTPYGEIDLVMRDVHGLVFVEVKTRTGSQFGFPEQAVTGKKLEHMVAAALSYVTEHPEWVESGWRIDVVAIRRGPAGQPVEVEHFEDVAG